MTALVGSTPSPDEQAEGQVQALSFSTPAFGRGGDQTGMVIIQLTDWAEARRHRHRVLPLAGCQALRHSRCDDPHLQPGFRGGSTAPVQFVLQGNDYAELYQKGWAAGGAGQLA